MFLYFLYVFNGLVFILVNIWRWLGILLIVSIEKVLLLQFHLIKKCFYNYQLPNKELAFGASAAEGMEEEEEEDDDFSIFCAELLETMGLVSVTVTSGTELATGLT